MWHAERSLRASSVGQVAAVDVDIVERTIDKDAKARVLETDGQA